MDLWTQVWLRPGQLKLQKANWYYSRRPDLVG